MLRAAQLSGLAYYSPTTHLALHTRYGPWFALRAVAVFDCEGPDPADSVFDQITCPYPELEQQAGEAMQRLEGLGGLANWQAHWRDWAALRGIGGKHTDSRYCYCADQLEYHYTKAKAVLARAVNALHQEQQQQQQQQDQQIDNHAAPCGLSLQTG
ncbi:hypothetical protein OEZ85_005665 [Tetradesmus obliquus]|uniref:Cyanocobalamin reductase (cyanide-eliminating) n=1 Tax=Tetradesmus obliquus TaxID=3088 RepID=A0ABY8UF04_TETOB|nr:hypothetical protein OEZ85_005665 [Tetradesmus obliquus]